MTPPAEDVSADRRDFLLGDFESPLLHGLEVPETTLEALAARYLSEIASSHPSGPLFLLGYSFGALLAYDDEKRGWAPCLGGEVEVGFLKGNHLDAFQGENLPTLVERTRRFLR